MARAKALWWELSRLAGEAARGLEACSRMSDRRRQTEGIALTLQRQIACCRVGTARTELLPRVKQESPAELCREGGCDRIHHRSPAQSGAGRRRWRWWEAVSFRYRWSHQDFLRVSDVGPESSRGIQKGSPGFGFSDWKGDFITDQSGKAKVGSLKPNLPYLLKES